MTDPIFWYLSDTQLFLGVASTSTVVGLSTWALDGPLIKVPRSVTRKLLKGWWSLRGVQGDSRAPELPGVAPTTPCGDTRATRPPQPFLDTPGAVQRTT